jgi:hypothetical protein
MAKTVKAKASTRRSAQRAKVGATAQEIQAKRAKNALKGSKLHYNDKGAMTLAQAIDTVLKARKVNPEHGEAEGRALSAKASERRQWCLDNPQHCFIVNRETVQLKEIDSENPRPENAMRQRLKTLDKAKTLGYIRYLVVPKGTKAKGKHAESVILYRKA